MADFNFTPAKSNIAAQPGMTLGEMMNMATQAQALQQAQQLNPLQLQAAQQTVEQARQMNPLQLRQQTAATTSAESKLPFEIRSSEAGAKTAELKTSSDEFDLATKRTNGIVSRLTGLINNPMVIEAERNPAYAEANKEQLAKIVTAYGGQQAKELKIPSDEANLSIAPYLSTVIQTPGEFRQFLKQKLLTTVDHASRINALQPSGVQTSTGAVSQFVSTNEFGPYTTGTTIPGTQAIQQAGPATKLIAVAGDGTGLEPGTEYLKGPQGPIPVNAPPPGRMVTGSAPATQALLTAAGTVAGPDWVQTVSDASTAQARIGLFQDIKKYAPEAFTGVGGERKALAAGIARIVGIDAYMAEQTATEQLSKNANLLALAGGNTDAARSLAEAANPNKKLNEESIKNIVDQLIGVEKMKLAKQSYLQPFTNSAQEYQKRKLQFDRVADPRLFQEMTPESVDKLKKSMSPAAIKEMTDKIKAARALGILK